jgi:ParB/RepB/Spo0J family partition protein
VVREIAKDKGGKVYEIIAGERRWRASQQAGLKEIPVVVREVDDRTVVAMALIENIQREDLNPLEEAQALQRLIDEFDLTHAQAAEAVGRSRAAVSNLLRLLELPSDIRTLVETRAIEMGHARALLSLTPQAAIALARQAVDNGWSVREVEHRVQQGQDHQRQGQAAGRHRRPGTRPVRIAGCQGERPARPRRQGPAGDPLHRPRHAGRAAGAVEVARMSPSPARGCVRHDTRGRS